MAKAIPQASEPQYLPFSNEKTAQAFESLIIVDQRLEVPPAGPGCNCTAFSGMATDLTPCAAKRYVDFGGNLVKAKPEVEPS